MKAISCKQKLNGCFSRPDTFSLFTNTRGRGIQDHGMRTLLFMTQGVEAGVGEFMYLRDPVPRVVSYD